MLDLVDNGGPAFASNTRGTAPDHTARTYRMLAETFGISLLLTALAAAAHTAQLSAVVWALALPRGAWILRHYAVGHEAAHGKLFPGQPETNALWGQLALTALLTPLLVFRKIHQFHHGNNRRDEHTSALEVVFVRKDSLLRRAYAWGRWLFLVFGAGWFWHGLVSVLLFLMLPVRVAERISPAFKGWSVTDRCWSIAVFGAVVSAHATCWLSLGVGWWLTLFGAPLLVFSWIYSLQLYIYHYDTSIGADVGGNTRCLGGRWVGWWILNLNEHATHHRRPAIVWYMLPQATRSGVYSEQQPRASWWWGVVNQLRGPRLFVLPQRTHGGKQ